MNHSFKINVVRRFKKENPKSSTNIAKAVIIENLAFWIKKNSNRGINGKDGYYWTWDSAKSFYKHFDYMSEKIIQSSLLWLENNNIIKSANYNKIKFDKTKWYTIVDSEIMKLYEIPACEISSNGKDEVISSDSTRSSNGQDKIVEPIPDINTDINPNINIKEKNIKKEKEEDIKMVYDNYPTKCVVRNRTLGKSSKDKDKIERLLKKHTVDDLIEIQELYTKSCKKDNVYMKNYSTFLNNLPDKEQYKQEEKKEKVFNAVEYRNKLKEEAERNGKLRESDNDTRTYEEVMADMKKGLMEQNRKRYGVK